MRVGIALVAVSLVSCAACPRPVLGLGAPRVTDQARGLPNAIVADSAALFDETQVRHCQLLFEPAFSAPHAVWLVEGDAAADAMVFVTLRMQDEIRSYSAPLDRGTARRLSTLCLASLTSTNQTCPRVGADGVWYHAAHPVTARWYAMASFWSPRPGTIGRDFVKVAEALRNYASLPEALRSPAWIALQEAADVLSERLASAG